MWGAETCVTIRTRRAAVARFAPHVHAEVLPLRRKPLISALWSSDAVVVK